MTRADIHTVHIDTLLWRVHRTRGLYALPWDALRYWGPTSSRFDPQPEPPDPSPLGVAYAATDVTTALAEVFQRTRVIDTFSGTPQVGGWKPRRHLELLDLTGDWPIRHHASQVITSGPKSYCRAWARQITATFGDLDGLWSRSSLRDGTVVVLWTPAAGIFPATPDFTHRLSSPALRARLQNAANRIGYELL